MYKTNKLFLVFFYYHNSYKMSKASEINHWPFRYFSYTLTYFSAAVIYNPDLSLYILPLPTLIGSSVMVKTSFFCTLPTTAELSQLKDFLTARSSTRTFTYFFFSGSCTGATGFGAACT